MALNVVWIGFILLGFGVSLVRLAQGDLTIFSQVLTGIFDTAKTGFDISLGLVGVMSLWLGVMKIGERAGVIGLFARAVSPLFVRLTCGLIADAVGVACAIWVGYLFYRWCATRQ